ncbi:MAG: cupin domain-containing protein [Cytophagales bacterium]|nr:cupin domain-containing protein [Cytophagales bacterium]
MGFLDLNEIEGKELLPGFAGKFVHTATMTIAHWEIKEGSILPLHDHVHEQVVNMIEGELEMTIGGETRVMTAGQTFAITSSVPHEGKALTDCKVIDVFTPAREDYK